MPSVTELLDTFPEKELVEWKLRVGTAKAKKVSEEALEIGSTVDQAVQDALKGIPATQPICGPAAICLGAWQEFLRDHSWFTPSLLGMQEELQREDLVGHPDFRLTRNGLNGIIDLKCASAIRPSYWTQVAAYGWLWVETGVEFLGILRLDKVSGKPEYQEISTPDEIKYETDIWLDYVHLYRHRQRVAERSRIQREEETLDALA